MVYRVVIKKLVNQYYSAFIEKDQLILLLLLLFVLHIIYVKILRSKSEYYQRWYVVVQILFSRFFNSFWCRGNIWRKGLEMHFFFVKMIVTCLWCHAIYFMRLYNVIIFPHVAMFLFDIWVSLSLGRRNISLYVMWCPSIIKLN